MLHGADAVGPKLAVHVDGGHTFIMARGAGTVGRRQRGAALLQIPGFVATVDEGGRKVRKESVIGRNQLTFNYRMCGCGDAIKTYPAWVALEMESVKMELVYPSQLHESVRRPPLPLAQM